MKQILDFDFLRIYSCIKPDTNIDDAFEADEYFSIYSQEKIKLLLLITNKYIYCCQYGEKKCTNRLLIS